MKTPRGDRRPGRRLPPRNRPAQSRPRKLALEPLEHRALLTAVTTLPANLQPHQIFPGEEYAVGTTPAAVVTGDLNGDGNPDAVAVNQGAGTVSVLLGKGGGTFTEQVTYAVGNGPVAAAIGKLTPGGHLDLVVANRLDGTISVLRGRGDGTFEDAVPYAVGAANTNPQAVAIGDLDGDSVGEVVVANGNKKTISVLKGYANRTFSQRADLDVGANPSSVALGDLNGDLNGDGKLDIMVANRDGGTLSVLLHKAQGSGAGDFEGQVTYALGTTPVAIAAGDVSGDGRLDVVAANRSENKVSVLLGDGDGTFGSRTTYAVGAAPVALALGDLNGDAKTDVVVANQGDGTVSVLLRSGTGTFAPQVVDKVLASPSAVALGDTSGDGVLDLITTGQTESLLLVRLGAGDGTFHGAIPSRAGARPTSTAVGDLNGDGIPDAVTANSAAQNIAVLLGRGDGTYKTPAFFDVRIPAERMTSIRYNPVSVVLGDMDRDGILDVVTANQLDNSVSVLLGTGTGRFRRPTVYNVGPNPGTSYTPVMVALGRLNADGFLDIVTVDQANNSVSVLLGRADGTFRNARVYDVRPTSVTARYAPAALALGDLSGDGILDIATANSGNNSVSVLRGNGDGTFVRPTAADVHSVGQIPSAIVIGLFNKGAVADIVTANYQGKSLSVLLGRGGGRFAARATDYSLEYRPWTLATGDFNGDGSSDLVVTNAANGSVSVLPGNINGTFGDEVSTFAVGNNPYAVAVADLNRDGMVDLVTADRQDDAISALLNTETLFARQVTAAVGPYPTSAALGDVNGDGKQDMVVANRGDNSVSVRLGQGDGTFADQETYGVGVEPSSVALGDVDGDGFLDIVTANQQSDTISVLLGVGDGTFDVQTTYATGLAPLSLALDDVDGDSDLDVVTANRDGDNVSVLLNNGDGTFAAAVNYGAGDEPVSVALGDLNGDSLLDIVSANRASNNVSVLLNTGGGAFGPKTDYAAGLGPTSVALGRMNAGAALDAVVANYDGKTVSVLLGNGDGTFASQTAYAVRYQPWFVTLGDVNADGNLDAVTANQGNANVSLLVGKGDGEFASQADYAAGGGPYAVALRDLNRDRALDIVAVNHDNDPVSVLLHNARQTRLGTTAFQDLTGLHPARRDLWFSLTASHQGYLTLEAIFDVAGGDARVTLYDEFFHEVATSESTVDGQRLDFLAAEGKTFFFSVTGPNDDVDLRVANLVQLSADGKTVTVYGRDGVDDTFQYVSAPSRALVINGASYAMSLFPAATSVVAYAANGPFDINATDPVSVAKRAHDVALIDDTPDNDVFTATRGSARMASVTSPPSQAFSVQASGFETVRAFAVAGGRDVANLTGSGGPDTLDSKPDYTRFWGTRFVIRADHFEHVNVKGSASSRAYLRGSTGTNRLDAAGRQATLTNSSVTVQVTDFGWVRAIGDPAGTNRKHVTAIDFVLQTVGPWINVL